MRHISATLYDFLPNNYHEAIKILQTVFLKISPKYSLENMIFQDFVEIHGIKNFKISMEALEHFTKGSSSEFAIRRFILKHKEKTMTQMQAWANSKDEHVRRLASEGCRPRLPWAIALLEFKKNPEKVIEILEILKDDESEYVRRSVANNLNDISKDNPSIVKEIAQKWIGYSKQRDWIVKHGYRTLLKSGDKEILKIFGFGNIKNLKIDNITTQKIVNIGEKLEFSFSLSSKQVIGKTRLEYAICFLRQNSKYSKKVFRISERNFNQKEKQISKAHSFKHISTRKYYAGKHKVIIIINGEEIAKRTFLLR